MKIDDAVHIAKTLIGLGLSDKGAAAAVGNAWVESGLSPIAPSRDGSDGLWQWRDAADVHRLSALKDFASAAGQDWRTEEIQCRFLIHELETEYPGLLDQLKNPGNRTLANLTLNFCDLYERPAASGRAPERRIAYAMQTLNALGVQPTPTKEHSDMPTIPPVVATLVAQILAALIKELIEDLASGKLRLPDLNPMPHQAIDLAELAKTVADLAAKMSEQKQ